MLRQVYKILTKDEYPLKPDAKFPTEIDARDGFIHLSNALQAPKVANRFYGTHNHLYILTIPISSLPAQNLKWEAPVHPTTPTILKESESMIDLFQNKVEDVGGKFVDSFPHLYDFPLVMDVVENVQEVKRGEPKAEFDKVGEFEFELEW
ncbi:hypothetical protein HDU76_008938 [Blyttiomyces sp. JEL0837]|nr:hypothetical protein HDU76_008938 [Blyttiomyces sp. JEL0837]